MRGCSVAMIIGHNVEVNILLPHFLQATVPLSFNFLKDSLGSL